MTKASVILTSYNKPLYLERAICSVLNQTYDDVELIVGDDNSSNKFVHEILEKYKTHPKIKCFNTHVEEKNRRLTARYATVINQAVTKYSEGDFIFYLADDDFYYPNMVKNMIEFSLKIKKEVCFCPEQIVNFDGSLGGVRFFDHILYKASNILDHNQVMSTRNAWYTANGWNDSPHCWGNADAHFWDRLSAVGYCFYPIDDHSPLCAKMYRQHSVQWNLSNGHDPWYGTV
jgi:spore maturation protein CgeD